MKNFVKWLGTQSRPLLSALCAIALVAVIGFSFAACGGDDDDGYNPFLGTWSDSASGFTLTFTSNTTWTYSYQGTGSGTYTYSGNSATLKDSGGTTTAVIAGNYLTLVLDNGQSLTLVRGGGGTPPPNTSLNGTWRYNDGTTLISISGSTGTVSRLGNSWSVVGQSAVDRGYVKVGTEFFRYINKTGDRSWTAQRLLFNYNTSAPNVCVGTEWSETGTITMDSNGKSFVFSSTATGTFTDTFYRE
jgi:hypothetical protein